MELKLHLDIHIEVLIHFHVERFYIPISLDFKVVLLIGAARVLGIHGIQKREIESQLFLISCLK